MTGAERYFEERMKDPKYRRAYKKAQRKHFWRGFGSVMNIWPRRRSAEEILADLDRDLREDPRLRD